MISFVFPCPLQPVTVTLKEQIRNLVGNVIPMVASVLASRISPEGSVILVSWELTDCTISPPLSALVREKGWGSLSCCVHHYLKSFLSPSDCDCSVNGSIDDFCNRFNGQCSCWDNISGRDCSSCIDGFFSSDLSLDCQPCGCNINGSIDQTCDKTTGECPCIQNVMGNQCSQCQMNYFDFPNCL